MLIAEVFDLSVARPSVSSHIFVRHAKKLIIIARAVTPTSADMNSTIIDVIRCDDGGTPSGTTASCFNHYIATENFAHKKTHFCENRTGANYAIAILFYFYLASASWFLSIAYFLNLLPRNLLECDANQLVVFLSYLLPLFFK